MRGSITHHIDPPTKHINVKVLEGQWTLYVLCNRSFTYFFIINFVLLILGPVVHQA